MDTIPVQPSFTSPVSEPSPEAEKRWKESSFTKFALPAIGILCGLAVVVAIFSYMFVLNGISSRASIGTTSATYHIDVNTVTGTVDPYPLGYSFYDQTMFAPYPYDAWQYLRSSVSGLNALKQLGVRSLRIWSVHNDWENPYDPFTGVPPVTWVDPKNKTVSCDPFVRSDCVITGQNVGAWCSRTTVIPVDRWIQDAGSFGGPIVYVANTRNIVHLKSGYYTVCESGQPAIKSYSESDKPGVALKIDDQNFSFSNVRQYFDVRDATPQDTIKFLQKAKSLGYSIQYVEVDNEPWNNRPPDYPVKLNDSGPYVEKLKLWYSELKKYDPAIQVGAAAVQVLNPSDLEKKTGKKNPKWVEQWNRELFKKGKDYFDFVVLHHYTFMDDSIKTISADQANNLSYYKVDEESDELVNEVGGGDYPKIYRKQLLEYAPEKVNTPILMTEFNTLVGGKTDINPRSRLFAGFALGSFYMSHIWPNRIDGVWRPNVLRAYLGGAEGVMSMYLPPKSNGNQSDKPVYFPSWYILQILSQLRDVNTLRVKKLVKVMNSLIPSRNAMEFYAASTKDKKKVTVVIFNHDPNKDIPINMQFANFTPKKAATVTTLGEGTTTNFLSENTASTPQALTPQKRSVQLGVVGDTVNGFVVPAHTFVYLEIDAESSAKTAPERVLMPSTQPTPSPTARVIQRIQVPPPR